MASERDIQDAERTKLESIVAAHGTEAERFQLVLSGVMRNGVSLGQFEGTEPFGYLQPESEVLARLARRLERRAKLGLSAVPCAGDPPTRYGCSCLEQALDEPGNAGKRHVLQRAAALHWSPPPRSEPAKVVEQPTPARQEAEQKPPAPREPQKPEPTPKAAPPVRVVHRTRRWFDDFERPHFSDMTF